jgi:hypothetical protein
MQVQIQHSIIEPQSAHNTTNKIQQEIQRMQENERTNNIKSDIVEEVANKSSNKFGLDTVIKTVHRPLKINGTAPLSSFAFTNNKLV